MARRDERNRNNRKRVNETTTRNVSRIIEGGSERKTVKGYYAAGNQGQSPTTFFTDTNEHAWLRNQDDATAVRNYGGNDFSDTGQWASNQGKVVEVRNQDYLSRNSEAYGQGYTGTAELVIEKQNPDKRVSDTVSESSTRYQALDKMSSDDDAQKNRKLKTKREGRNKLRIQLSGDSSGGRLKVGPNAGRKSNKLKIDVQSAGSGSGLNVPR